MHQARRHVKELDKLAARRGYQLACSVGRALGEREKAALALVPQTAWEAAMTRAAKSASAAPPYRHVGTSAARTGPAGTKKRTSPS